MSVAILHTVNRSAYHDDTLCSCLRVALPGCAVLLLEDGVYAARAAGRRAHLIGDATQQIRFYALDADLQARGIAQTELLERIGVVDYRGFVGLACEFDKVLAWF